MSDLAVMDEYGVLTEPSTLKVERRLPGPVERVWSYLTQSELREKWLAAGDMAPRAGAEFQLTWRNDTLTDPPGKRPEGFGEEHTLQSTILEFDPCRKLVFTWGQGEVEFRLRPDGKDVLLTLVHRRISDRKNTVMIGAGWHAHLEILAHCIAGTRAKPFWDRWLVLREDYDRRIPRD